MPKTVSVSVGYVIRVYDEQQTTAVAPMLNGLVETAQSIHRKYGYRVTIESMSGTIKYDTSSDDALNPNQS